MRFILGSTFITLYGALSQQAYIWVITGEWFPGPASHPLYIWPVSAFCAVINVFATWLAAEILNESQREIGTKPEPEYDVNAVLDAVETLQRRKNV